MLPVYEHFMRRPVWSDTRPFIVVRHAYREPERNYSVKPHTAIVAPGFWARCYDDGNVYIRGVL